MKKKDELCPGDSYGLGKTSEFSANKYTYMLTTNNIFSFTSTMEFKELNSYRVN
jgi:hypothetical protein